MAYSASKWGLRGITKAFALELGPYNVNVNNVCPGMVDGPRFRKVCEEMSKRLGIPVEAAMRKHAEEYALKREGPDAVRPIATWDADRGSWQRIPEPAANSAASSRPVDPA